MRPAIAAVSAVAIVLAAAGIHRGCSCVESSEVAFKPEALRGSTANVNPDLCYRFFPEGAELRVPEDGDIARYNLGYCAEAKVGVRDAEEATIDLWYELAARKGSSHALERLWRRHLGVERDPETGEEAPLALGDLSEARRDARNVERGIWWLNEAASRGDARAAFHLAQTCEGVGFLAGRAGEARLAEPPLRRPSLPGKRPLRRFARYARKLSSVSPQKLYEQAVEGGYAPALVHLVVGTLRNTGPEAKYSAEEVREILGRLAQEGHAGAMTWLGHMMERGLGGETDAAQAAEWYGQAAEKGDTDAAVRLGTMLVEGRDVPRDLERGMALLRSAALSGNSHGMAVYGVRLWETRGDDPARENEALDWMLRCDIRREEGALEALSRILLDGLPDLEPVAREEAPEDAVKDARKDAPEADAPEADASAEVTAEVTAGDARKAPSSSQGESADDASGKAGEPARTAPHARYSQVLERMSGALKPRQRAREGEGARAPSRALVSAWAAVGKALLAREDDVSVRESWWFLGRAAQSGDVECMRLLGESLVREDRKSDVHGGKTASEWLESAAQAEGTAASGEEAREALLDGSAFVRWAGHPESVDEEDLKAMVDHARAIESKETPEAWLAMGVLKMRGAPGVRKDVKGGLDLLKKAYEGGNGKAAFLMARSLEEGVPGALKADKDAACVAYADAYAALPNMAALHGALRLLADGHGDRELVSGRIRPTEAVERLKKAADEDLSPEAMELLGLVYLTGLPGVAQDREAGCGWLLSAADIRSADESSYLEAGRCLERIGSADYVRIRQAYQEAADLGSREAEKLLKAMGDKGLERE